MGVDKIRDVVILSVLKDGIKSKQEIESRSGLEKDVASKALRFLRTNGLVSARRSNGAHFYGLTSSGHAEIENVFRKMGKF